MEGITCARSRRAGRRLFARLVKRAGTRLIARLVSTFKASWEKALRKVSEALNNVGSRMAFEIFYGPKGYHLNCGDSPGTTNVGDEESLLG